VPSGINSVYTVPFGWFIDADIVSMPKRRHRPKHPRFDPDLPLQRIPLAGQLDLHGLTTQEAESAVRGFIDRSRRRQPGCVVLIITGKGKGSAEGPVLRPAIQQLLKTTLSGYVEEWALDDSEGAFRVRLR
jgi:DNA-nicking Smr family endonuclease